MRDRSQTVASIKGWLYVCDEHHTTCINASDAQSTRPTSLIDVEDQCIVQGDVPAKYIALSYTWLDVKGQSNDTEHMQLLSSNMQSMKTPDALRKDAARLPTVIKDAIELTSLLGERWLWVDRLCIVQDGPQKMSECMHMDKIYAGAYFTIAAAAQGGLFAGTRHDYGVSDGTTESTDAKIRRHYHILKLSKWAKRAWTYQEYILSKRIVFFLDTEIFWQCEIAIWDPNPSSPNQDEQVFISTVPNSTLLRHLETPEFPDLSLYADIICPYNGRELSYEEDGLSACLGILNRLEPAFPGGFMSGLPRLYLDHALLWQPLKMSYDGVDTGRSTSRGGLSDGCAPRTGPSNRRPSLPSWAWCGWQCFVDPESLLKAFNQCQSSDQDLERNPRTLQNLVTWKPVDLEEGNGKGLCQKSKPLSTLKSSSQSNLISARVQSACFLSAATLALRVFPRILLFKAGFVRARVNPVLGEKPLGDLPRVVVIQDRSGQFSGLLRITGNSIREEGQEMKLVAISQGCAKGQSLNKGFEERVFHRSRYHDGRPFLPVYDENERWIGFHIHDPNAWKSNPGQIYQVLATGAYKHNFDPPTTAYEDEVTYEFFNVLWVEDGDDGVSYRAGCGYVLKDRWEAMTPTETDITLG